MRNSINCYNKGTINSLITNAGGIASTNDAGIIRDCYNEGKISAKGSCGGIVGANVEKVSNIGRAMIVNCSNLNTINGSGNNIGGIVGRSSSNLKIISSHNSGDIII